METKETNENKTEKEEENENNNEIKKEEQEKEKTNDIKEEPKEEIKEENKEKNQETPQNPELKENETVNCETKELQQKETEIKTEQNQETPLENNEQKLETQQTIEKNQIQETQENEILLTDEKLTKYFSPSYVQQLASSFANGYFDSLITNCFMVITDSKRKSKFPESPQKTPTPGQPQENTPEPQKNNPPAPAPNIMFSNMNINNNSGNINIPSSKKNSKSEFSYALLEQLNDDDLTQQILLTVTMFCLLKLNRTEEVKVLINRYNYPLNKTIFPLILLKCKYYSKIKNNPKAIDIYSEAIEYYEKYSEEDKLDLSNIITIETFHQKFIYFDNLFNFLFGLNNIEIKIKKLYFELKICLTSLKFYSQAYTLILELSEKYPDDFLIQFELARDSIMFSKFDKYQEVLLKMMETKEKCQDENKKKIYENYLLYTEALLNIAQNKYDETQSLFNEILKNDENNVLILNNMAVLNIYKNKPKECCDQLNDIISSPKLNCGNECIKNTLTVVSEKFNST